MTAETAVESSPAESVPALPSDPAKLVAAADTTPPAAKQPPPPTSPKSTKGTTTIAALAAVPANVDAFLAHLQRCTKTRGGTDVVLLCLTYSLRLGGAVLDGLSRTALRASARKLVELAFQLPPASTVVVTGAQAPPLAAVAMQLSARIKALVAMLSEWRTMNRMWGVMGMYFAAKEVLHRKAATSAEERFHNVVDGVKVGSLMAYHALEATTWLSSKQVLAWSPKAQGKMISWAVKAWAISVAFELTQMLVRRASKTSTSSDKEDQEWTAQWNTEFLRALAWAPLTVHWSLPGGLLPELAVAALATYPSIGYMKDVWKSTA